MQYKQVILSQPLFCRNGLGQDLAVQIEGQGGAWGLVLPRSKGENKGN